MTARISLILGKTRGHGPRLQMLLHARSIGEASMKPKWFRHQDIPQFTKRSRKRHKKDNAPN